MNDYIKSLIRTYVPVGVGTLAAWLAAKTGIVIDEQSQAGLVLGFGGTLTAVYYGAVRFLERKFPAIGVLLGKATQPVYGDAISR